MIPISMMFTPLTSLNLKTPKTKSLEVTKVIKKSWPPEKDDVIKKEVKVNGKTKLKVKEKPQMEVSNVFNNDDLFVNKRCG